MAKLDKLERALDVVEERVIPAAVPPPLPETERFVGDDGTEWIRSYSRDLRDGGFSFIAIVMRSKLRTLAPEFVRFAKDGAWGTKASVSKSHAPR